MAVPNYTNAITTLLSKRDMLINNAFDGLEKVSSKYKKRQDDQINQIKKNNTASIINALNSANTQQQLNDIYRNLPDTIYDKNIVANSFKNMQKDVYNRSIDNRDYNFNIDKANADIESKNISNALNVDKFNISNKLNTDMYNATNNRLTNQFNFQYNKPTAYQDPTTGQIKIGSPQDAESAKLILENRLKWEYLKNNGVDVTNKTPLQIEVLYNKEMQKQANSTAQQKSNQSIYDSLYKNNSDEDLKNAISIIQAKYNISPDLALMAYEYARKNASGTIGRIFGGKSFDDLVDKFVRDKSGIKAIQNILNPN